MPTSPFWAKLNRAKFSSEYPSKTDFWPEGSLQRIIQRNDIITELNLANADNDLVDFILGNAMKLLVTCLMSQLRGLHLEETMRIFQDHNFNDRDLPVEENVFNGYQFAESLQWTFPQMHSFLQYQWKFVAQTFSGSSCVMESPLPDETILPFIEDEALAQGNFGTVHKVTVHPWHFDRDDPIQQEYCQVAIKEVTLTGNACESLQMRDTLTARERRALLHVLFLKEEDPERVKHIVDVKAIFDQGKRRYYMFPWADGGHLWNLWERPRAIQPQEEGQFVADIFAQILGLAGALAVLHQENFRHGDLKPENILIFRSQDQKDIWKIADLGLAKFHYDPTVKRPGPTSIRHGSVSYEPPEFLHDIHDNLPTSRLYDMWSKGCIILQLITWLVYNIEEVEELVQRTRNTRQNESTFWIQSWTGIDWGPPIVHGEVTSHIETIMTEPYVSEAIKDLLKIVRDQLLVVPLPDDSNDKWRPGYRANAYTLYKGLERILRRGEENHGYWFSGGTFPSNQSGAASSATEPFGQGYDHVSLPL